VILATVGTHGDPFPRFLDLLAGIDEHVIVQYGHNDPPPGLTPESKAFFSFAEMLDLMHAADAVITHAGVGSILCARDAGHVPVVVPRLHRHGEHVDDHQAELTQTLEARGHVVAIWPAGRTITHVVAEARARRNGGYRLTERPLHAAVREALDTRARV